MSIDTAWAAVDAAAKAAWPGYGFTSSLEEKVAGVFHAVANGPSGEVDATARTREGALRALADVINGTDPYILKLRAMRIEAQKRAIEAQSSLDDANNEIARIDNALSA